MAGIRLSILICALLILGSAPFSSRLRAQNSRPAVQQSSTEKQIRERLLRQKRQRIAALSATGQQDSFGVPETISRPGFVDEAPVARQESVPSRMVEDISQPMDLSLESLTQLAIENHPSLNAATARTNAVRQEAVQAGLHPNPQLGVFADEVGNDDDPGLIGVYLQRKIIRGNKLNLARQVKNREAEMMHIELEVLATRIKTDVKTAYYRVLVAQQKSLLASQLVGAQAKAIEQATLLFENDETPKTDLLQSRLQAQKTEIIVAQTNVELEAAWRQLRVVTGLPTLPQTQLTGSLDEIGKVVSFEVCQEQIFELSPELKRAASDVARAQSVLNRALAQAVPDYQTQFTVGKDSSSEHFFAGVQLQVPLMICDRNQGNIAAARARILESMNQVERIKRLLTQKLATQYQQYQLALVKTELYQDKLLPQAQQNLELLTFGYPEEVEILAILTAQQAVVEFSLEYLESLNDLWTSRTRIEGLLLDQALSN